MKLVHCLLTEQSSANSSTYGFGRLKPHCPTNVQITVVVHELNIDGRISKEFFSLGLATNFHTFHFVTSIVMSSVSFA